MNDNFTQFKHQQIVTSNSLLRLHIPKELENTNCYYQWEKPDNNQKTCIFTRFELTKITKNFIYQCSPLDYGAIIIGRILVENESGFESVQEFEFGPVTAEKELGDFLGGNTCETKMVVNKNHLMNINIDVIQNGSEITKDHGISILFSGNEFNFELKVKDQIRLPSNNSFFKFYDNEPESIGVSMYHQHSEFMEKLKNLKIYSHFGFYIKVCFENRMKRDIFLFEVIQKFGIKVSEFEEFADKDFIIEIKESLVMREEKEPNSLNLSNHSNLKKEEIDEEIYKLLYEASEAGDQLSIDMAEAEILFASSKKLNLTSSRLKEMKDSGCDSLEKRSQFLTEKHPNQIQKNNFNNLFQSNNISEKKELEKSMTRLDFGNSPFPEAYKNEDSNYLRSTISKLNNQVQNLMKENKKLSQENKRLRDENMRLRFKEVKSNTITSRKANDRSNGRNLNPLAESREVPKSPSLYQDSTNSPTLFRTKRSKSKNFEEKHKSESRNMTGTLSKIHPSESMSFITITPNSPSLSEWSSNQRTFQAMSMNSYNEFIKEEPEEGGEYFKFRNERFANSRSKSKRKSYERIRSPSRLTQNIESMIMRDKEVPMTSQILPSYAIKQRNQTIASSHYINGYEPTYRR